MTYRRTFGRHLHWRSTPLTSPFSSTPTRGPPVSALMPLLYTGSKWRSETPRVRTVRLAIIKNWIYQHPCPNIYFISFKLHCVYSCYRQTNVLAHMNALCFMCSIYCSFLFSHLLSFIVLDISSLSITDSFASSSTIGDVFLACGMSLANPVFNTDDLAGMRLKGINAIPATCKRKCSKTLT